MLGISLSKIALKTSLNGKFLSFFRPAAWARIVQAFKNRLSTFVTCLMSFHVQNRPKLSYGKNSGKFPNLLNLKVYMGRFCGTPGGI